MKRCFKCGEWLLLAAFYPHPAMGDGYLGKCKECAKQDVKERYAITREHRHEYEKMRYQRPERRRYVNERMKEHNLRHPDRCFARRAVGNAIRAGRLIRQPCRVCGAKAQAHHWDYSKPLDVDWLCFKHHREIGHGQKVIAA